MRDSLKIIRLAMWAILAAILAAWLAVTVQNPRRAETVFSVVFSPDGASLAAGTDDGSVVLFDLAAKKRMAELKREPLPDWTKFVLYSPDGRTIAAGGDGSELAVWDVATKERLNSLAVQFGNGVNCGTFSPDGNTIAIGSEDDTIRIWNWKENSPPREIITAHKQRINAIAFSPDGAVLATGSDDETVRLAVKGCHSTINGPPAVAHTGEFPALLPGCNARDRTQRKRAVRWGRT